MVRQVAIVVAAAAALSATTCAHRPQVFTSKGTVVRFDIIRRDPAGVPLTADLDIEWSECPGEQREVQRVDAKFIACFQKHKVGENLPLEVLWSDEGWQLDWDVTKVGDCARAPEPDDDVSFDMVHECTPEIEQGQEIGFKCNREPSGELLKACPWFRRH
jgi:hypothetical protein